MPTALRDRRNAVRQSNNPGRFIAILVAVMVAVFTVCLLVSPGAIAAAGWSTPINLSPSSNTNQGRG